MTGEPRMAQCRCVLVSEDGEDRCPSEVPYDQPFCESCEARHVGFLADYHVAAVELGTR